MIGKGAGREMNIQHPLSAQGTHKSNASPGYVIYFDRKQNETIPKKETYPPSGKEIPHQDSAKKKLGLLSLPKSLLEASGMRVGKSAVTTVTRKGRTLDVGTL